MGVTYQRPGRPVWIGVRPATGDLQGAIPRAWCVNCGTEIFLTGREFCLNCEKEATKNGIHGKSL